VLSLFTISLIFSQGLLTWENRILLVDLWVVYKYKFQLLSLLHIFSVTNFFSSSPLIIFLFIKFVFNYYYPKYHSSISGFIHSTSSFYSISRREYIVLTFLNLSNVYPNLKNININTWTYVTLYYGYSWLVQ